MRVNSQLGDLPSGLSFVQPQNSPKAPVGKNLTWYGVDCEVTMSLRGPRRLRRAGGSFFIVGFIE